MVFKKLLDRFIHVFEVKCSQFTYVEVCHDIPHFFLGFLTASIARIHIFGILIAFLISTIYVYYQSADRAEGREEDTIIDFLTFSTGLLLGGVVWC